MQFGIQRSTNNSYVSEQLIFCTLAILDLMKANSERKFLEINSEFIDPSLITFDFIFVSDEFSCKKFFDTIVLFSTKGWNYFLGNDQPKSLPSNAFSVSLNWDIKLSHRQLDKGFSAVSGPQNYRKQLSRSNTLSPYFGL